MTLTLNDSQQEAYDKILGFLNDPNEKYFILSGGPGTGKTFLINYLMQNLIKAQNMLSSILGTTNYRECYFTATTNSAVDNLMATGRIGGARTIQSALGLRVQNGALIPSHPKYFHGCVVVVDEYTLIDYELFNYLNKATTKVILIGDTNQLAAVKGLANELKRRKPNHVLTTPMRTKSEDILKVVDIFLGYVQEKEPEELNLDGMSDVQAITQDEFLALVADPSTDFTGSRIITHTNKDVIEINQAIRATHGLPEGFTPGERVVLNKYVQGGVYNYKTDSEYTIKEVLEDSTYVVVDDFGICHRMDTEKFDLRSMYCSTIYKAQGRSFDTIYINLSGFPTNTPRSVLTRSLYVAASRARKRIVFIGDLSEHLLGRL